MYSASVVDIAVMVCILEAHVMGAPAKHTSQPDRDLDVIQFPPEMDKNWVRDG